jgi:hypothetical protein
MNLQDFSIIQEITKVDDQISKEQSRVVKICMLKYKCFIVGTFIIFSLIQILLILVISGKFNSLLENISVLRKNVTQIDRST